MSLSKTKSQSQNPLLAAIVAFLSVTLFFYAVYDSFRPESPSQLVSLPPPPPDRQLSSEIGPKAHHRFGSAQLGVVKLGCLDPVYGSIDTEADIVRLSGRLCGKSRPSVREAHVRHVGRDSNLVGLYDAHEGLVSTEFFPLDLGENIIELELALANGKSMKTTLKIARREPAFAGKRK